jgi:catechol 2,3-dioxygenase-like lactoylglutathione lyase family enzyme
MYAVFDHVTIRVSNLAASRRFYELALGAPTYDQDGFLAWDDFLILAGPNVARRLHIGFRAPDRASVDDWWERLTGAGYASDGSPGPRPQYTDTYYGAFVLDPDGNSIEKVHHDPLHTSGIGHVWVRTHDLAAAKRFYETIAPFAGIELKHDSLDRLQYRFLDGDGNFTYAPGEPTENVHLAFAAPDRVTVDAFHGAALAACYRDNGAPGERSQYHPGYYGAFVLDPDGHNVEAVFHDRR